eukprot:TRINITY_DN734_c0_g4_i1.p1 TRINITY_DN734_c0_g4~~TRINITY_DN734_c0_g4_i1.p1  ORF type:complete len:271 (+),score=115.65 TRINITY_DN734_c0_g4_i1:831-1643(+)
MKATDETGEFLFGILLQSLVQGYIKDIREMQERELYFTPAILVLELLQDLPHFPLEAVGLIFTIRRYKRCMATEGFEFLRRCSEKGGEKGICALDYEEKKKLLLVLTRGLFVSAKVRELTSKSVQNQKDQRQLERKRATLQKEVNLFESFKNGPNPLEVTAEKKKEMTEVTREILKISNEIKKKANKQTLLLGTDAEDNQYWLFAGDKGRVYVKAPVEGEEQWATYSSVQQVKELLDALLEKGVGEKKLKSRIEEVLRSISLVDSSVEVY